MATGSGFVRLLDCHGDFVCQFHQHEWGNHASLGVAHGSWNHAKQSGFVRIGTRWIEPARQSRGGLAAGSLFRTTRGAGGEAATTPYLLTRYFGLRAFSTLYGLTWTFYAAAGAIGPVLLGKAFDVTGSYAYLLGILAAALAVAAAMNLFLPRYPEKAIE